MTITKLGLSDNIWDSSTGESLLVLEAPPILSRTLSALAPSRVERALLVSEVLVYIEGPGFKPKLVFTNTGERVY